eukprot:m.41883 g.41883  ORF g.41883 m.41883 type:complete len:178 (+) comp33286_c0_seq1:210-743(+)
MNREKSQQIFLLGSLLLFPMILQQSNGQFSGNFSLPTCRKDLCIRPCANLSNEMDCVKFWVDGWPNERIITLGLTLQPKKKLTDLKLSLKYDISFKNGGTLASGKDFPICHGQGTVLRTGLHCPLAAMEPNTVKWSTASQDIGFYYNIVVMSCRSLQLPTTAISSLVETSKSYFDIY